MNSVSVCFITYDRLVTLAPTYDSFLSNTSFPRQGMELIVCDDCSPRPVQEKIRDIEFDKYIFNGRRRGLGSNQNNGIRAAAGDFILQIQDDWECIGPVDYLEIAIRVMKANADIGMIILGPRPHGSPLRKRLVQDGITLCVLDNEPGKRLSNVSQGAYTDWPHLKRPEFHKAVGYYEEGSKMWDMELNFCQRVNDQEKYYVAYVEELSVFRHIGADFSYNTGNWRSRVAKRLIKYKVGRLFVDKYMRFKKQVITKQGR